MTISEFNELSLEQRCDSLWEWGFYLGKCKELGVNKVLYAMNGYFVEMHLQISENKIIEVVAFGKHQLTEPNNYDIDKNNPIVRSTGLLA